MRDANRERKRPAKRYICHSVIVWLPKLSRSLTLAVRIAHREAIRHLILNSYHAIFRIRADT